MEPRQLVGVALQASIFLTVFGVGLQTTHDDLAYVCRRPSALARALLAMFVVMPGVAILLSIAFEFHPAVEIALLTVAISPVPPLLTNRKSQAGGHVAYGIGLMTVAAVVSIALIPIALNLIGGVLRLPIRMAPSALARLAMLSVVFPLGLGMLVHIVSPTAATKVQRPVSVAAITGLVFSLVVLLTAMLPTAVTLVVNGTLLAFTLFVSVGLVVGHALGGPIREERAVVALTTACRHPAIAIAVASENFPQEQLVPAAVLLYLLVNVAISIAYIVLQRQSSKSEARRRDGLSRRGVAVNDSVREDL